MKTSTTSRLLAITLAAFASFGAQADEADASQFSTSFESVRARADVQKEASAVAKNRSIEPAGSRVLAFSSTADRAAVHADAVRVAKTHSMEPAGSRVLAFTSTADRAKVRAEAVAQAHRLGE